MAFTKLVDINKGSTESLCHFAMKFMCYSMIRYTVLYTNTESIIIFIKIYKIYANNYVYCISQYECFKVYRVNINTNLISKEDFGSSYLHKPLRFHVLLD